MECSYNRYYSGSSFFFPDYYNFKCLPEVKNLNPINQQL